MKLFCIYWEDGEGKEITDHVVAPDMDREKATKWVLDEYRDIWSDPDMDESEINNLDYYALDSYFGTDKREYKIILSPATLEPEKFFDYLLAMQGYLRQNDVPMAKQYASMVQELLEKNSKATELVSAKA